MNFCKVDGCGRPSRSLGMCNRHYEHARKNGGDPISRKAYSAAGSVVQRSDGYKRVNDGRGRKMEHVVIAEKALGKPMPKGAQVHHIDEDRGNNNPSNLVICQSRAYHALIHQRQDAFDASGHYDWLKCRFCKSYDEPARLARLGKFSVHAHRECYRAYQRERYMERKSTPKQLETNE